MTDGVTAEREQLRLLEEAWAIVAEYWRDDVARDFDARHLAPLRQQTAGYLSALAALRATLNSVEVSP